MTNGERIVGWAGIGLLLAAPTLLDGMDLLVERLRQTRLHTPKINRRLEQLEREIAEMRERERRS